MSLPTETGHVPPSLTPHKSSAGALRTAYQIETVHTLIQQNEDLSARLNVTLRRTSQLEIKIQKLEDAYDLTVRQNDALVNETDVLREKMNHTEQLFLDAHAQKEEIQKTFAELYSRSRETEAQLSLELSQLQRQLSKSARFHRRVLKYVKPGLRKAKDREQLLEKQISHLRTEADRARQISLELNQQIEAERRQKVESDGEFHQDLIRLASNYETQMAEHHNELIQLRVDCERQKEARVQLTTQLQKSEEERVRFQNDSIREFRARQQIENERQFSSEQTAEQQAAFRLHIQSLEIELNNLKEISKAAQLRAKDADAQVQLLTAQLEDQKTVREATLNALQDTAEREARSARLNVELSRALKESRSEIERLNIESIAVRLQNPSQEKIADGADTPARDSGAQSFSPSASAGSPPTAPSLSQKIENILSEIQGSQYLPQDWIETQGSSDMFKFSRPGKGITTAPVEPESIEVEPMEFESAEVEEIFADDLEADATTSSFVIPNLEFEDPNSKDADA